MGKRIGPEAKIITLFTALPEDSKRIVLDIIKSQTAPRKTPSKPQGQKKTKDTPSLVKQTSEGAKETPGNVI